MIEQNESMPDEPTPHELTGDEWTAAERAQLDALATERAPSPDLKGRTIAAARAAGYLRPKSPVTATRTIKLLAAASLIFAAGTVVGYALARRAVSRASRASANREAVAAVSSFVIDTDPGRHVVWY
jgi:hypothetical protein